MASESTLRRYILLTLTHIENQDRSHYNAHFVASKIRNTFNSVVSIVVSTETHKEGGSHYHVGILNNSASKNTATMKLREAFPEFEGRQLNVTFHRSWNTICAYIIKEDKAPYCWGTTIEEVTGYAQRYSKPEKKVSPGERLMACKT